MDTPLVEVSGTRLASRPCPGASSFIRPTSDSLRPKALHAPRSFSPLPPRRVPSHAGPKGSRANIEFPVSHDYSSPFPTPATPPTFSTLPPFTISSTPLVMRTHHTLIAPSHAAIHSHHHYRPRVRRRRRSSRVPCPPRLKPTATAPRGWITTCITCHSSLHASTARTVTPTHMHLVRRHVGIGVGSTKFQSTLPLPFLTPALRPPLAAMPSDTMQIYCRSPRHRPPRPVPTFLSHTPPPWLSLRLCPHTLRTSPRHVRSMVTRRA